MRAHAHEAEEFAGLLVAIAGAVFRQAQRQVAITARHRREDAVVMRAVHRLEVVAIDGSRTAASRILRLEPRSARSASSIGGNIDSA